MAIANFPQIDLSVLQTLMPALVEAKRPFLLHGPVGVGKSSIVTSWARANGYNVVVMMLPTMDDVDIRGLVYSEDSPDGKVMKWAPPSLFPKEGCLPTILFIDEFYAASESVQTACSQLLLDRRVGDYVLPDNVIVVAATNDASHNSFSANEDNTAINTRVTHFMIKADSDNWLDWARSNKIHPAVVAWISFAPESIYDEKGAQEGHMTFSNPRVLEALSDAVYSLEKTNTALDSFAATALFSGIVGEYSASQFRYSLEQVATLLPLHTYVNYYTKGQLDKLKEIAPNSMQSLYGLSLSLISKVTKAEDYQTVLGIMNTVCIEISDKVNRKEVFSMFFSEMVSSLTSFNFNDIVSLLDSKEWKKAEKLGGEVSAWAKSLAA